MVTLRSSRRRTINIILLIIALGVVFVYIAMFPLSCESQDESRLDTKTSYGYAGRVVDRLFVSEKTYYTHIDGTLTEYICIRDAEKETQEKKSERKGSWAFNNRDLFLNSSIGDEVFIIIGENGIRLIENWTTGWNAYYFRPATEEEKRRHLEINKE